MAAVLRERPEHEGVIVPWALDFRLPRHRLALLPPEIALRLARWCGLALHRTEILNLMKKEDVLALRKEVGEEGHAFVLRRSALLPIPSRCDLDEKVFPEGALLSLRIRNSGFTAMALCLADAPAVVASMAHRCASPDFAALLDAARARASLDTARDARTHWPLLFTLIRREVAPIWAPCFF
jgi:hypothetical protein